MIVLSIVGIVLIAALLTAMTLTGRDDLQRYGSSLVRALAFDPRHPALHYRDPR